MDMEERIEQPSHEEDCPMNPNQLRTNLALLTTLGGRMSCSCSPEHYGAEVWKTADRIRELLPEAVKDIIVNEFILAEVRVGMTYEEAVAACVAWAEDEPVDPVNPLD